MIEPLSFLVTHRQLQPLLTPQAFHFLVVDLPTLSTQQLTNHAVTIAAILFSQSNKFQLERIIISLHPMIAHGGARNACHHTSTPLRNTKLLAGINNCLTLLRYAQAFGFR